MTISFSSQKTNILALTLKENSIRFINLFDSKVINEISGISLNKYTGINDFEKSYNNENFKKIKINKNKYLVIFNEDIGKIQLLNIKTGKIVSNLNLILKNFVSKTEKEKINLRKLKLVEIVKPYSNILVTYDEIKINENVYGEALDNNNNTSKNFLNSNLKFWKITDFSEDNFTLELISLAENPHNNESIKSMISFDSKLITYSNSFFKVWDLNDEEKLNCIFMGSYRKEKINSVQFIKDLVDNNTKILSLHNNRFLVKWDLERKQIENVYSFGLKFKNNLASGDEKDVLISLEEKSNDFKQGKSNKILLKGENTLIIFNFENNEIEFENNFDDLNDFLNNEINGNSEISINNNLKNLKDKKSELKFKIIKAELFTVIQTINKETKEEKTYIRFISKINNFTYLIIKCNVSKGICEIENFFYVKRMYLRHMDFSSLKACENDLSLIMINNNLDVLITKREFDNKLLKVKLKRNTVDEENIEKEFNEDIVNNFDYYKHDENKNKKLNLIENNQNEYNKKMDVEMSFEVKEELTSKTSSGDLFKNGLQKLKIKKK